MKCRGLVLTRSLPSLQSVQHRDRSTSMVSTRVFPALVPVRSLLKSALQCVAVGVGVLLAQCSMKRLMLVSM